MKENKFLDGVSCIDTDVVERFVSMDDQLIKKAERQKKKTRFLRFGALAASFALILGVGALIYKDLLKPQIINPPDSDVPTVSTVTSGNKITGKQEILYGEPTNKEGEADMIAPGFEIQTVIEAEVIEVLPDTYYYASSYYLPFHVAKLRVVDQIRGDGLPTEIFLSYPYYGTNIFDGYERFIMSLEQVGIENYMLVNDTQSRVDYFSNMFEVCISRDLGYGSVIAFNDGRVDESFWKSADYLVSKVSIGKDVFEKMLDSPNSYDYPASKNSTVSSVKSNIIKLANDEENYHISSDIFDFVTSDDVFVSDEAKAVKNYVQPSETDVFMQKITLREDRVIADYTRIINGFITDENICINGYTGDVGNVSERGEGYTRDDLCKVPDIAETLDNMKLSELAAPHIDITSDMHFSHSNATGVYRKVNGKVYGIIRIMWYYGIDGIENAYQKDDMYVLYDENGNGKTVGREELKSVIGDDYFIQKFSYDAIVAWD